MEGDAGPSALSAADRLPCGGDAGDVRGGVIFCALCPGPISMFGLPLHDPSPDVGHSFCPDFAAGGALVGPDGESAGAGP